MSTLIICIRYLYSNLSVYSALTTVPFITINRLPTGTSTRIILAFSIMTLRIIKKCDAQHNNTQRNDVMSFWMSFMLSFPFLLLFWVPQCQWGSVTHQMAVPVPSIGCCVLNHHNIFYQIQNALAFNQDTCCHLVLCYCCFFSIVVLLSVVVSSGENLNIKQACFKDQRGLKISYTNAPAFSGKSTAIY